MSSLRDAEALRVGSYHTSDRRSCVCPTVPHMRRVRAVRSWTLFATLASPHSDSRRCRYLLEQENALIYSPQAYLNLHSISSKSPAISHWDGHGRSREIDMRLSGDQKIPTASILAHSSAPVDIHTAWNRFEAIRQSQTVSSSALTPPEALRSSLAASVTAHRLTLRTHSYDGSTSQGAHLR